MPQQRPKKQENVEGRIIIARNINWRMPDYIRTAIDSPVVRDRLAVFTGLAHLHRVGNDLVQAEVVNQTRRLIHDDSGAVSAAAMELMTAISPEHARQEAERRVRRAAEEPRSVLAVSSGPRHYRAEEQDEGQVVASPTPLFPTDDTTARSIQPELETWAIQYSQTEATTERQTPHRARPKVDERARRKSDRYTQTEAVLTPRTRGTRKASLSDSQDSISRTKQYIQASIPHSVRKFGAFSWSAFLWIGTVSCAIFWIAGLSVSIAGKNQEGLAGPIGGMLILTFFLVGFAALLSRNVKRCKAKKLSP
ncbi:MAG: hypothetical protein JOZ48_22735 [Acidobacteriaceae bacterium]|nr:hypothetical protein [Acidobacteriaceae bacterium]